MKQLEDHFSNFVNLLRGNEEIIVRMHNTEQRDKLWEELGKNNQTILNFDCTIDYLTSANEQVCYNFEAEIVNIPEKTTIENQDVVCNNAKISILKDEYKILEKRILKDNMKTSVYRNMQDYVNLDRVKYIHQKIGAAQAQGAMTQIGNVPIFMDLSILLMKVSCPMQTVFIKDILESPKTIPNFHHGYPNLRLGL